MEKIYDENQKKQQNKKIKVDGVTMLSFAVALFAIVSLIAAGVSGFSFALPDSDPVQLPDTFKGEIDDTIVIHDPAANLETEYHYYKGDNDKRIPLICLESDVPFQSGDFNYTGEYDYVSTDAGLLYLLANLAPNNTITYATDTGFNVPADKKDYVDFWVTQNAIWTYLFEKGVPNNTDNSGVSRATSRDAKAVFVGTPQEFENFNTITNASDSQYFGYKTGDRKIYDNAFVTVNKASVSITDLLDAAKSKKGLSFDVQLTNGDGVVTNDKEMKYYFSPLYTVVPTLNDDSLGALENYSLEVKAYDKDKKEVDVGAVVTNEKFEVVKDVSKLTPTQLTKFYVRVPTDKVTQNVTVHVEVTATFKMYNGLKYKVGGKTAQTVTTVQFARTSKPDGKSFDLAPAPDTGISAGQTIYFVGLIVLLCGVGIIYANAKPTQVQN